MIQRLHLANMAMYVLAASIFGATALLLILFLRPINVLSNWSIVAPTDDAHIGQTIVVQSLFTKLRAVNGTAHRTLICNNSAGAEVAYPINDAVANHAAQQHSGVGIPIVIPTVVVPAKCKLAISIEYQVYPFRTVTEFATSNQFNVVK